MTDKGVVEYGTSVNYCWLPYDASLEGRPKSGGG